MALPFISAFFWPALRHLCRASRNPDDAADEYLAENIEALGETESRNDGVINASSIAVDYITLDYDINNSYIFS